MSSLLELLGITSDSSSATPHASWLYATAAVVITAVVAVLIWVVFGRRLAVSAVLPAIVLILVVRRR